MKERPILFSTEIIKAILDGRKTMTRRVVKLPVASSLGEWEPIELGGAGTYKDKSHTKPADKLTCMWHTRSGKTICCAYGQVGDRLWVRETWSPWADKMSQIAVHAEDQPCLYRADYREDCKTPLDIGGDYHWHSARFMFKKDTRLWLEITNIRVERVQDITGKDVISEGVQYPVTQERHPVLRLTGKHPPCAYLPPGLLKDIKVTEDMWLKAHFAGLWDDLNYDRGYSWESNPWVWVIEFKRVID